MRYKNFIQKSFRQLFGFILITSVLGTAVPVAAQRRVIRTKPIVIKNESAGNQPAAKCSGGWSGIVTFSKTLKEDSNEKGKNRIKGTTHYITSRDYNYAGKIFVNNLNPQKTQTKAQIVFSDTDKKFKRYVQNDTCFYDGKGSREQWSETTDNHVTKAFGEGEADFSMSVYQAAGVYQFSFRFAEITGAYNREVKVVKGGWCQPKNNEGENKSAASPTKVEGEGDLIEEQPIDPKNPDVLSGSKTWDTSMPDLKSFVYTVTWSFRRCPAELEILDVEFAEHPYPDFDSWKKIEDEETVDSNIVRIRAKIVNYSAETKFPKIEFKELKENITLENSETSISIAPGEIREVDYLWDTSGFAWVTGGFPMSRRQIKVELTENIKSEMTKEIVITPRPVVLAHGLWADYTSWDGYDKLFYKAHSSIWRTFAVGKDPANRLMNTGEKGTWKPAKSIIENAEQLGKQIEFVQKQMNAWHLDVVAHSMGGLITRSYINDLMKVAPDGKPTIGNLVMLGTPNMGSPCADLMGFTFWSLGKPVKSLEQLRPKYLEGFNRAVRNRKGVKFSNLVGTSVPATCQSTVSGDGVVEIPSAIWEIGDIRYSKNVHTALTSEEDFWRLVWRRLSVSRLGNQNPDPKQYQARAFDYDRQSANAPRFVNASFDQREDDFALPETTKVNLAKEISLAPRQTIELDIPAETGGNSAVTFMAQSTVSATLVNDKNVIVGQNAANSPEAGADFARL